MIRFPISIPTHENHPDSGLRFVAARKVMGLNSNHLSGRSAPGGEIRVNLISNQAQQMELKTIEGTDYLFIENGGFSTRNAVGWTSPWYVFKREVT